VAVPETTLRKGLKLKAAVTSLQLERGPSGRVSTAQVTTPAGTTKISGATLRLAGGLRSTWITQLATLSLTRPGGPVRFGKTVTLTGRAQGVKGALLQQRVDGVWTKVGGPGLKANVKLLAPASFRITAGKLAGSVLKVPVAPLLTARPSGPLTVAGTVKPLAAGVPVELQLDTEGTWSTVATTATGAEGKYSLVLDQPGRYRARTAPAQGFAEGLSGQIELR
jgi:hypothetical protein